MLPHRKQVPVRHYAAVRANVQAAPQKLTALSRRNDSLSPAPCLQLDSGNQIRHCPSAWHDLMRATQQIVQFVLRIDTQQLIECGNNVSWNQR